MIEPFSHEYWMQAALNEAQKALEQNEIPIGAVVVAANRIIARGYNQTETLLDVTAHAEMIAITAAESAINNKFLNECSLYITIEPCVMCAGAIKWARFGTLVYGASEPKVGYSLYSNSILHPKTKVISGVLATECAQLMTDFFQSKRS